MLKLPNLNMRKIFVEYFNELHHIDVSTRYADMMQTFVNDLNLEALFAGYWKEYVSQLPEAVFQQVNENFYRTTFKKLNTTIDNFGPRKQDTGQVAGYVEGLRAEYPEAKVSQHVIYCFGNQGYRVFRVS